MRRAWEPERLLQRQEALVLTAYRAQGLRLVRRIARRPWSILVLAKSAPYLL